ncbi:hypothetical protein SSX86_012555 [Deinandra increscens subsp. villosa]|uniref:Uncharacterized protein n=1 Tax=Deinandra increscens subsp. villosa TaxID=3103831 RepID=A0AAP0D4G2_9ASTR
MEWVQRQAPGLALRRASFTGVVHRRRLSTTVLSFGSVTGIASDAYEPTPISTLPPDVSTIAASHYHSLVVTSGGHLWSWDRNVEHQLGRYVDSPSGYELEMEAEAKDSEEEPEGVIARQSERKIASPSTQNKIISSSIPANKSPENGARNIVSATRITSPTIDMKSNIGSAKRSNKCNPSDAFNMSSCILSK